MAAKDRMAVLSAIMDQSIIPVFYHPDVELCKDVIQACANGGAKCVEFTNRGDFAAQVFLDVTRYFAKADPSVIMGVGCALVLFVIRVYNPSYPEGCSFAILFMNVLTPLIDKLTAPKPFGAVKPARAGKEA